MASAKVSVTPMGQMHSKSSVENSFEAFLFTTTRVAADHPAPLVELPPPGQEIVGHPRPLRDVLLLIPRVLGELPQNPHVPPVQLIQDHRVAGQRRRIPDEAPHPADPVEIPRVRP